MKQLKLTEPDVVYAKLERYNIIGFYVFNLVLSAKIENVYFELHGNVFLTDGFTILGYSAEIRDILRLVSPKYKLELVNKTISACKALVDNTYGVAF